MVDENDVRVVLIDSLTGYLSALPKSDQAVMQIQSLVKYLSRRGVLSILIVANHGLLGHNVTSDIDVSSSATRCCCCACTNGPASSAAA